MTLVGRQAPPLSGPSASRRRWWALAFLLYAGLGLLQTFPLVLQIGRVVPNDVGDPLLNTWILWWNAHHLPFSPAWWNAPMFYPQTGAIALSEHLVGLTPLTSPLQWLGVSPLTAYTAALLLSFPLSAAAAHLLGFRLTLRHDAALVAGLAFGLAPYRAANLAHLQVVSAFWMPVALLALHAYLDDRRIRWLVVFGAAWLLQSLTNGYFLLYFSVLVALWIGWFVRPREWRAGAAMLGAWAVVAAPLVPVLLTYRRLQEHLGLARQIREIQAYSADFTSLVHASPLLVLWRHVLPEGRSEAALFPGLAAVLLVAGGVLLARPLALGSSPLRRRTRAVLACIAGACVLVAASAAVVGPWSLPLGAATLSVSRVHKPITLAALGLLVAFLLGPRFRVAWARRSTFAFYTLATLALWLLSFGPMPRWGDTEVLYRGPYFWLMMLPGFDAVRVPARFAMPAALTLAAAAALAFGRLVPAVSARRRAAAAVCALAIVADGWMMGLPLHQPPAPLPATTFDEAAPPMVLEIPIGVTDWDTAALYRAMSHGLPLVNGYSGYAPPHYAALVAGIRMHDPAVLDALARSGPLLVSVEREFDVDGATRQFVGSRSGARFLSTTRGRDLYLVPAVGSPVDPAAGSPLPIMRLGVSTHPSEARLMVDGDLRSRWMGVTPQNGRDWIEADLGAVREITGVSLAQGPFITEFPRSLRIEVSEDASRWKVAWRGMTAGRYVRAALEHPAEARAVFAFDPEPARYVRLDQEGTDTTAPWGVAELAVLGPPRGK